jgi:ABC-type transport system involved in multi-copper enzyme maturation permease subunit
MNLIRISVIAQNVFREVIRDRVLYLVPAFVLFLGLALKILPEISSIASDKIFVDLGLATTAILGLMVTIFVGTNLINKEIEKRTVIVLLAKPVSRSELILGKHLGLSAVVALLVGSMTLIFMVLLSFNQITYAPLAILLTNIFLILQLSLIVAVAILFGVSTSSLLATLMTFAIFLVGQFSPDLIRLINLTKNPELQKLAKYLYMILPDLSRLNYRDLAVYNALPDATTLAINGGYGLLYTLFILAIAMLIFGRRQF